MRVSTPALERSLSSGLVTIGPVVEPGVLAYGDDDEAREELRVFLADYLSKLSAAQAARFFLPEGVTCELIDVPLDPGSPSRTRSPRPVAVTCIVVPHGGAHWVLAPALDASFHVDRKEDLHEVARRELTRVAAARELDGDGWRKVLPPLEARVVGLDLSVGLEAEEGPSEARLAEEERRRAIETLLKLATRIGERLRGRVPPVGRERELASFTSLLGGRERLAVLVAGDEAVGKTALVEAWAAQPGVRDAWVTSVAQLVAGASGFGEAEARLGALFKAAERLDAVLYIEDFGALFRERPEEGGHDVTSIIRRFVVEGRVRVIGELTPLALERAERRDIGLVGAMTRLMLPAMEPAGAAEVLRAHTAYWRRAESKRPQLAAATVPVVVELARRYLPYRVFPGKAVRLAEELRAAREGAVALDGTPVELVPDDAYDGFSLMSGIPSFLLREDRAVEVDDLVARLRKRLVGQEMAVRRVAETLCTVKAQLQPADKPLATFLFVGPTGVGKTELARSVAHMLFGSEERLVRFDMSEYADPWAAQRLIRGSDTGDGQLTARVREQPFSVVLLDEIEKAHPAVHDLLLQVAGEGRLTDARGRTSYFHNTIIILTSNLGAHHGGARDDELRRYRAAVEAAFRPEMLNRFDAVIPFHRLLREEVAEVTRLHAGRLADRRGLVQATVTLDISAAALDALASGGYSATYGVRALRRHLDEQVVAPSARLLAKVGVDGHGGVIAVRVAGEPLGLELPAGSHLGTLAPPVRGDDVPALEVSLHRRGGQGGRKSARGVMAVAACRRIADRWMIRDIATEVVDQVRWLESQLAGGDQGTKKKPKKRDAISGDQRKQMYTEQYRLKTALEAARAARDEIAAAEELALEAALAGDDIASLAREADVLLSRFERAMFWLAVGRLEHRDTITLGLSAPEVAPPLERWVKALLLAAPARAWAITGHLLHVRDPSPVWPESRVWGQPRSAAWLLEKLEKDPEFTRNILLRVRGQGAACLLGLEAGGHRFAGVFKQNPAHLVVRRLSLDVDFDDAEWLRLGTMAAPAVTPKGQVERTYTSAGDHVMVYDRRVDVPWEEHFARLEEVGLAVIERGLEREETPAELYPVELKEPEDDEGDGDDDEDALTS
ncbi:MAG TPA: AAA family ATPase [Kofleriaceae bacterium]|nr:AAA family ATPase [Kofleriaceae bacterium]